MTLNEIHQLHEIHTDYFVYPGHPLISAYLILQKYKTLEEARDTTRCGCCEAETNVGIPGAGGVATSAVGSLIKYQQHRDISLLVASLHYYWICLTGPGSGNFEENFLEGLSKANKLTQKFVNLVSKSKEFFDIYS